MYMVSIFFWTILGFVAQSHNSVSFNFKSMIYLLLYVKILSVALDILGAIHHVIVIFGTHV